MISKIFFLGIILFLGACYDTSADYPYSYLFNEDTGTHHIVFRMENGDPTSVFSLDNCILEIRSAEKSIKYRDIDCDQGLDTVAVSTENEFGYFSSLSGGTLERKVIEKAQEQFTGYLREIKKAKAEQASRLLGITIEENQTPFRAIEKTK